MMLAKKITATANGQNNYDIVGASLGMVEKELPHISLAHFIRFSSFQIDVLGQKKELTYSYIYLAKPI
jgi:hypothetical protein